MQQKLLRGFFYQMNLYWFSNTEEVKIGTTFDKPALISLYNSDHRSRSGPKALFYFTLPLTQAKETKYAYLVSLGCSVNHALFFWSRGWESALKVQDDKWNATRTQGRVMKPFTFNELLPPSIAILCAALKQTRTPAPIKWPCFCHHLNYYYILFR